MIGTAILTLIIFSMVYPVLTREKITRGRVIWLFKQQREKEHLKRWKPMSEDAELVFSKTGLSMKGTWRSKPKLRHKLKDKKVKLIGKVCISLVVVLSLSYVLSSPLILFSVGAAFTSKASGDWDAAGQTTWNEVGIPVSGDTAAIQNTHFVRIDNGTGNEACLSVDVQTGGELRIDSEGAGALSLTFDDAAAAGFGTSAGQLTGVGTAGSVVTITAANPGSNPWDFFTTMDITADYTTFSYYARGIVGSATVDIDNCIFDNASQEGWYYTSSVIQSSFNNNTISNTGGHAFVDQMGGDLPTIDNITITNPGSLDVLLLGGGVQKMEFTNSTFDITNVSMGGTDVIISDTHGDVAGAWAFSGGATNTYVKSDFNNDFVSSDNVTIYAGLLTVDEAAAHNDLTIKSGGTFDVNGGITQTITNTGTITVDSGGTLDWTGTDGNRITLVSDAGGTQWSMNAIAGSTVNVSWVDVTDSDATAGDAIDATDGTNTNGGNNDNWDFPAVAVGGQKTLNTGFTTIAT